MRRPDGGRQAGKSLEPDKQNASLSLAAERRSIVLSGWRDMGTLTLLPVVRRLVRSSGRTVGPAPGGQVN